MSLTNGAGKTGQQPGGGCFKKKFTDTETFEISLEGLVQVCWGKGRRRVMSSVKTWPQCSRLCIFEGPSYLLSSLGVGGSGAGSDDICLATGSQVQFTGPLLCPFLFTAFPTRNDHKSTLHPLLPTNSLSESVVFFFQGI